MKWWRSLFMPPWLWEEFWSTPGLFHRKEVR